MSKKAKTASKNNPGGRTVARKYIFHGKEVKPVRVIAEKNIMAAAYADNDQLIRNNLGNIMPWKSVATLCS